MTSKGGFGLLVQEVQPTLPSQAGEGSWRHHSVSELMTLRWPWWPCKIPETTVGAALLELVVAQLPRPGGTFWHRIFLL